MATFTPRLLLLDLALPRCGISSLPAIQRLSPSTKILVFAGASDETEAISALKSGAKGYHGREIDASLLKKAVEVIQKGEVWVGRNVVPRLLSELTALTGLTGHESAARLAGALDHLTPREREIARLIGGGSSNKEMARQLKITERTVKAHLTAIFRKLGVPDRLRLALLVGERTRSVA